MTTLTKLRFLAHQDIDRAAGEARLRYITDIPGQERVYIRKAEQAKAFLLLPLGSVPPYVAAEAAATSRTAAQAANRIAAAEALWEDQMSPAIERERTAGKEAVSAATTEAAINQARDSAVAALQVL